MSMSRIINRRTSVFLYHRDIRPLSQWKYGQEPITKIKKKSDCTKYRIPLLNNNERTMWDATRGDQWNLGSRAGGRNYKMLATQFEVYPDVDVLPFKNFNRPMLTDLTARKRFLMENAILCKDYYSSYSLSGKNQKLHKQQNSTLKDTHKRLRNIKEDEKFESKEIMSGKGVTGTSVIGKSFGPPLLLNDDSKYDERFQSRILQLDYRSKMTPRGAQKVIRATVAVGNGKGMLGVGITLNPKLDVALKEAKQYGYQQLVYFPMYENGSIPYSRRGGYHRTELHAIPIAIGENKAQRVVKMMLDLAGYRGVAVKMFGRNTPEHLVKAFFNTFQNFESHQEQAENLGRYVVKFDPKKYFHPTVLAEPSSISASMPVPYSAEVPHSSQSGYIPQTYNNSPKPSSSKTG